MTMVVYIFVLILLLVIEFYSLSQDLLSPSVVVTAMLLISALTIIPYYSDLYFSLSIKLILIVCTGVIVFFITELFVRYYLRTSCKCVQRDRVNKEIKVSNYKIFVLILITLLVLVFTVYEVKRIANLGNSTGSLIKRYKNVNSFGAESLEVGEGFNNILAQISKVSTISAYLCAFIIQRNRYLCGIKYANMKRYFLPILLWIPLPILKGGRLDIIQFAIAVVMYSYILKRDKDGWNTYGTWQFVKKLAIAVPAFLCLFYILKLIMGIGSKTNLSTYIFLYLGSPLINFESYLENPIAQSDVFGKETFYRIYNALWSLGLSDNHFSAHLEFRNLGGSFYSNTYTFFRRLLQDFGYEGAYIGVGFTSFFYSVFYYARVRYSKGNKRDMALMIYGYMFMPCVLFPIEYYLGNIFTIGFAITLIMFPILYFWMTKLRFKVRI